MVSYNVRGSLVTKLRGSDLETCAFFFPVTICFVFGPLAKLVVVKKTVERLVCTQFSLWSFVSVKS